MGGLSYPNLSTGYTLMHRDLPLGFEPIYIID